jgi:hypothetical protein
VPKKGQTDIRIVKNYKGGELSVIEADIAFLDRPIGREAENMIKSVIKDGYFCEPLCNSRLVLMKRFKVVGKFLQLGLPLTCYFTINA